MKYQFNGIEIDSADVSIDDMPNDVFKEIFEFCGADAAISLLRYMPGSQIVVPSTGLPNYEKRIILNDFDGTTTSIRAIARKLFVSETYIRNVLNEAKVNTPDENQVPLGIKIEEGNK